jgi:hypothetical protein
MGSRKNPGDYANLTGLLLVGISVLLSLGLVTVGQHSISYQAQTGSSTSSNAISTIQNVICNVFNTIKSIIFILGLTLMLLGAALYSGANLMPAQQRGPIQGYGMSMIMGGVVGVAIAVAAPFILNVVVNANPSASTLNLTSSSNLPGGVAGQVCSSSGSGNYNPSGETNIG